MESDWFFNNTELVRVTASILSEIHVPVFTDHLEDYVIDFTKLTIIDTIDHYRQGHSRSGHVNVLETELSLSSSSLNAMKAPVVYKALYNGKIVFAEIWNPLTFQDQLAIMIDLSIQRTLPPHQFVPVLGAGYFKILNNASKILILKDCNEVPWTQYVKSDTLTWSIRLRLALELTNAIFYLHSRNMTIRDFSLDSAFINPDSSIRLDGCYEVNKLPFNNAVDISRRRKSLVAMQSYNNNIQQYGQLMALLVNERLSDGILRIRNDCPERLQALIEWCTDEEPLLLPTILDCLNEMEIICREQLPLVMSISPSSTVFSKIHNDTISSQSTTCSQTLPEVVSQKEEVQCHSDSHEIDTSKKGALKSLNEKINNQRLTPATEVETLTSVADETCSSAADGVLSTLECTSVHREVVSNQDSAMAKDKTTFALDLISRTKEDLEQIDNALLEYVENLRNPFSDLSQVLEDPAALDFGVFMSDGEDGDKMDLDKSIEGFQYLESILSLYDKLGHIKTLVDQVAKMSFSPRVYQFIHKSLEVQLMEGMQHTDEVLVHISSAAEFDLGGNENIGKVQNSNSVESKTNFGNILQLTDQCGNDQNDSLECLQFRVTNRYHFHQSSTTATHEESIQSIGIQTDEEHIVDQIVFPPSIVANYSTQGTEVQTQTSFDEEYGIPSRGLCVEKKPSRLPSLELVSSGAVESRALKSIGSNRRIVVPRLELSPELSITPDQDITIISSSYSDDSDSCSLSSYDNHRQHREVEDDFDFMSQETPLPTPGGDSDQILSVTEKLSLMADIHVPQSGNLLENGPPTNEGVRPLSKVQEAAKAIEMKTKGNSSRNTTPSRGMTPRGNESSTPVKPTSPRGHTNTIVLLNGINPSQCAGELSVDVQRRTLQSIASDNVHTVRRPSSSQLGASSLDAQVRKTAKDQLIDEALQVATEEHKQSQPNDSTNGELFILDHPGVSSKPDKPIDDKVTPPQVTSPVSSMPPLQLKTSNSFILKAFNKPMLDKTINPIVLQEVVVGDHQSPSNPQSFVIASSPSAPSLGRGGGQSNGNSSHSSPSALPPAIAKSSPSPSTDILSTSRIDDRQYTPSPSIVIQSLTTPPTAKCALQDSASMFLDSIRKLDSFYANFGDSDTEDVSNNVMCPPPEPLSSPNTNKCSTTNSRYSMLTPPSHPHKSHAVSEFHSMSMENKRSPHASEISAQSPSNLNSALSSFLQIVQRCSATSNRAKELIDNMDKHILASPSPKKSSNMQPFGPSSAGLLSNSIRSSSGDWSRTANLTTTQSSDDRARAYSPTTTRTITSAHYSGRLYSSPERAAIAEESRRKAALQAGLNKANTLNMTNKLSHEKNAISYSISPKSRSKSPSSSSRLNWNHH